MPPGDEESAVRVDFGAVVGRFRPLHGINSGPVCGGGVVDLSDWHARLDLPCTRLHDCGWPAPVVVDLPAIFPNFDADPNDPASYQFAKTDDYLESLVPLTRRVVYRLGTSIEHTHRKYHTHPPADFAHWARICVGVVRHLNEGWADGHRFGIRDFEIWNEPDVGDRMWSGSSAEYAELYTTAARTLTEHDDGLRVGGPAVAFPDEDFGEEFLRSVRADGAPLDFFSWHSYSADPAVLGSRGRRIRALLDGYGFGATESLLTEWNLLDSSAWSRLLTEPVFARDYFERTVGGPDGAAFAAAGVLALQDAAVDEACYYTGDTSWLGLFDTYGVPRAPYFALQAVAGLMRTPRRVRVSDGQPVGLTVAAGIAEDGGRAAVLVSNFRGSAGDLRLTVENLPPAMAAGGVTASAVGPGGLDPMRLEPRVVANRHEITLALERSGVYLLEFADPRSDKA